jgi:hypothetical protein
VQARPEEEVEATGGRRGDADSERGLAELIEVEDDVAMRDVLAELNDGNPPVEVGLGAGAGVTLAADSDTATFSLVKSSSALQQGAQNLRCTGRQSRASSCLPYRAASVSHHLLSGTKADIAASST